MTQDELHVKDNYKNLPKPTNLVVEYKIFKIWFWDSDDKKYVEFIKQPDIESVVQYCQFRKIEKYSIFDANGKNICNDGKRVLMGMG
jgi:hypothetical protein